MSSARSRRLAELAPLCLLVGFGVFWFSDTVADPDLWGHVRFGQDIIRTGSIIQTDTYSYRTAGRAWINHEWLAEVLFAAIYNADGPRGLIVAKVLVSLAIVGLCYAHLRRRGLGPLPSAILPILAAIPFRMGLATVRPQVLTYVLFLVELLVLERAAAGRTAGLWILPVLFAAWVNLHGGVLAGVGVLGLWVVVRLLEQGPPSIGRLAAIIAPGIVSMLALLLNPYGAALIGFLLRTATVPRPEISEWTPLGLASLPGLFFLGLLGIGILGLIGSRKRRGPSAVMIFAVSALLPFVANRHYPLFALSLFVLVGEHIADAWARLVSIRPWLAGPRRVLAVLCLVGALASLAMSPRRFGCIRVEPFYFSFPARAVALLERGGFRGNIAVPFDWGEYVIWHLGPAAKVSIDGRRETIYSDESYRQSRDLELGTRVWDASLKAPPATDLVIAPNGSPTANLLARTSGWLALYQDTCCAIFARQGLSGLERLVGTRVPVVPDDGAGMCFPDTGPAIGRR